MEFKDIAAISGKGGLYEIVKPTRNGVIVQSMDEKKKKMVVNSQHRVSVLSEVSFYTYDEEGSRPLKDVFKSIYKEFGEDTGLSKNASAEELRGFIHHVLPEYDKERVYDSDIKKLVQWYNILINEHPELIRNLEQDDQNSGEQSEENSEKS